MATTPEFVIYDGNPGNPLGNTPFGFFDAEVAFQADAPKVANFVAQRLGYPILDVELRDYQIYTCFEKAIVEYGNHVNQFRSIDHQMTLLGRDATDNLTGDLIGGSGLPTVVRLASDYATEVAVGGDVTLHKGYVSCSRATTEYDLKALWSDVSESGNSIEIRKVYHDLPPAAIRFYSPFHGSWNTGQVPTDLLDIAEGLTGAFGGTGGVGGYLSTSFIMFPAYEDLLRIQAIELNDKIRRSNYSFTISNNIIRFTPKFYNDTVVWFDYYVDAEKRGGIIEPASESSIVTDLSNMPFENISYTKINSVGRVWIYKYTLALAKETLGRIRSKYEHIPIPDSEIKLDGDLLLSEARDEQVELIEELRETLQETSKQGQMKREAEIADYQQKILAGAPLRIYIF